MSGPPDDGPSRHSMERAGIRSGGSVGLRIGLTVGGLVVIGGAVALLWPRGSARQEPADAGAPDTFRPIEIGMPVIIARTTVVPVGEEPPPLAPEERRTGAPAPRGERATAPPEPWQDPAAAAPTQDTPPPWQPQGTSPPAGEPPPSRSIVADDSPAAQAAVMAYRVNAQSAVQRQYLGQVQGCFDQATRADPSVSGSITIGFMTSDDGRVMSSRVIRDGTGRDVGACVAAAARSWRLPPPPRNALEMQMTFAL